MSIKKLFEKKSLKTLTATNKDEVGNEIESREVLEALKDEKELFLPYVDYSVPANFARYGSAEEYYAQSMRRIYSTYPYDGSLREQTEWHNDSTYLDRYLFENRYPRTTGHAIFSPNGWGTKVVASEGYGAPATASHEYITIKGGPNKGTIKEGSLATTFTGSNAYYTPFNQASNLRLNPSEGTTVEFWLKKDSFITSLTSKEVIFDLWNNDSTSAARGRMMIELNGTASASPFWITYKSGSVGIQNEAIGSGITVSSLADEKWNHYAFVIRGDSTNVKASLYVNGALNESRTIAAGGTLAEVTGALNATIGALQTTPIGLTSPEAGWGKLSGSIDEFRFWKRARTHKEIKQNWFRQVRGGTNTDIGGIISGSRDADLGVYYKFNEGVMGSTNKDSVVLDYSGRISNGFWTGYATNARSTTSAMDTSAVYTGPNEYKDPIIYPSHSSVTTLAAELKASGSVHDHENSSAIYNSIPAWITEEDQEKDRKSLLKLTQIISSYLDSLHLQIEALPKLKDIYYTSGSSTVSDKPLPFMNRLLENTGFVAPELFVDANVLESIASRNNDKEFSKKVYNVKNQIYQNIYNNLTYIYKSKGTEKAFRNLIRCFGVDDEIVKLNLYGDGVSFRFEEDFKSAVYKKKYIDFNNTDRFAGTVYQYADSANSNSSLSYISGSDSAGKEDAFALTVEAEAIFPKKIKSREKGYFPTTFVSASLYGMHGAKDSVSDLDWASNDYAEFQVYAVRRERESDHAYFVLTSSYLGIKLESSEFKDVYNNTKWNFATRFKPTKYPLADAILDTTGTYDIEFYGVNTELGTVQNQFSTTATVTKTKGINFLRQNKRLYLGAHYTNFDDSVREFSDAKLSSLRYWFDYLPDSTIKAHARDAANFGTADPYKSAYLNQKSSGYYVPKIDTLALHWDFATVTGSDSSGQFTVPDFSSGSAADATRYGWLGEVVNAQHAGRGDKFDAETDTDQVVQTEYVNTYRQRLPEVLDSADTIQILVQDDLKFTRESKPVNHFWAVEKSMYQTISEEMINLFSSVVDFNNLIGEPVNRYRQKYKDLEKLRQLFFERVGNTPDLDKYVDFYKWIDNSISEFLKQLIPASANMSDEVRTMIESHVLERNKYWTKFPSLEGKGTDPEGGVEGINRHLYNWKFGHRPPRTRDETTAYKYLNTKGIEINGQWYRAHDGTPPNNWFAPGVDIMRPSQVLAGPDSGATLVHAGGRSVQVENSTISPNGIGTYGGTGSLGQDNFTMSMWVSMSSQATSSASDNTTNSSLLCLGNTQNTSHYNLSAGSRHWYLVKGSNSGVGGPSSNQKLEFMMPFSGTNSYGVHTRRWTSADAQLFNPGWYHVALTYQSHSTGILKTGVGCGTLKMYVNGTEITGSWDVPGALAMQVGGRSYNEIVAPDGVLLPVYSYSSIGREKAASNDDDAFCGVIADVSYWRTPLSPLDIKNIYSGTSADYDKYSSPAAVRYTVGSSTGYNIGPSDLTKHPSASHLVSWWRMGDGTGAGSGGGAGKADTTIAGQPDGGGTSYFYDQVGANTAYYVSGTKIEQISLGSFNAGATSGYLPDVIIAPAPHGDGNRIDRVGRGTADIEAVGGGTHTYTYSLNQREDDNCFWWKHRAARGVGTGVLADRGTTTSIISSSVESVNTGRSILHSASLQVLNRSFTTPYRFAVSQNRVIHGGINYASNKNKDFLQQALHPFGPAYAAGGLKNIVLSWSDDLVKSPDWHCKDDKKLNPNQKRKYSFKATAGRDWDKDYFGSAKGDILAPFNLISSSISSGHNSPVATGFSSDAEIVNLHSDTYGDDKEVPMQGPFTEKWVGGHQSRHVTINSGSDTQENRPEAWRLLFGKCGKPGAGNIAGAMGFVGPDYPLPGDGEAGSSWGDINSAVWVGRQRPRASLFREEVAKRPLNIKNIKMVTGSTVIGNYSHNYEIVQTTGRTLNDPFFRDQSHSFSVYPESLIGYIRQPLQLVASIPAVVSGSQNFALPDRTGTNSNKSVIVSKFSSPGGFETLSRGFLDPAHEEYSVYNALPFRNLSVLGSGSGESNTMRVSDHLGERRGLRTLRTLHAGQYGQDSAFNDTTKPAWHKTNRNRRARYKQTGYEHREAKSILFGGASSTDYIDVGAPATWDALIGGAGSAAKPFSVSAWVYPTSAGGGDYGRIIEFGNADRTLLYYDNNSVRFTFGASDVGRVTTSNNSLPFNAWTHIVVTYKGGDPGGSNTTDYLKIYINGSEDNNTIDELSSPGVIATDNTYIGNHDNGGDPDREWGGYLDEISVWDKTLTAAEVTELYNGGIPTAINSEHSARNNIISYWPMGGGSDTYNGTIYDVVGTNNGTPANLATNATSSFALKKKSVPTYSTDSRYDNAFVTHQIPQSDMQYAWITASATSGPLGYETASVAANGASNDITFVSASDWGSYEVSNYRRMPTTDALAALGKNVVGSTATGDVVRTNFAGMVFHTVDPVTASADGANNNLGYPLDTVFVRTPMATVSKQITNKSQGREGFGEQRAGMVYGFVLGVPQASAYMFNSLMLNRNGPYQYPSWKQVRTGQHPVARHMRKNNRVSVYQEHRQMRDDGAVKERARYYSFTEPVVSYAKPIESYYEVLDHTGKERIIRIRHTYGNNLSQFSNHKLNRLLGRDEDMHAPAQTLHKLSEIFDGETSEGSVQKLVKVVTKEEVFPSDLNVALKKVRQRTRFGVEWWSDLRGDEKSGLRLFKKVRKASSLGIREKGMPVDGPVREDIWLARDDAYGDKVSYETLNAFGYAVSHGSRWPLDAKTEYVNASGTIALTGAIDAAWGEPRRPASTYRWGVITADGAGELQSSYSLYASTLATSSIEWSGSNRNPAPGGPLPSCVYARVVPSGSTGKVMRTIGDTLWEAGHQSGKSPAYTSYEEYQKDFSNLGKGYSIIPEFRISEQMPFYIDEKEGNFMARLPNTYELTGGTIGKSNERNFYRTYSHTDFMKHFAVVREKNDDVLDPGSITLKCHAIKKLLPYKGFYPALRTLELAGLYAQTYADSVAMSNVTLTSSLCPAPFPGSSSAGEGKGYDPLMIRGMTVPLFAPGVLYNTIKSGIACDYPIFAGRWARATASINSNWHSTTPHLVNRKMAHDDLPYVGIGSREANGIVTASLNAPYLGVHRNATGPRGADFNGSIPGTWVDANSPASHHYNMSGSQAMPYHFKNRPVALTANKKYIDLKGSDNFSLGYLGTQEFSSGTLGLPYTPGTAPARWTDDEATGFYNMRERWSMSFWMNVRSRGPGSYGRIIDIGRDRAIYLGGNGYTDDNGAPRSTDGLVVRIDGLAHTGQAYDPVWTMAPTGSAGPLHSHSGTPDPDTPDAAQRRNSWYHVVVNFDSAGCDARPGTGTVNGGDCYGGSSGTPHSGTFSRHDYVEIWLNGISGSRASSIADPHNSTVYPQKTSGGSYIGNRSDKARNFDGKLDEIMFFGRCMTDQEAKLLYNNGSPPNIDTISWPTTQVHAFQADLNKHLWHYWQCGDVVSSSWDGSPDNEFIIHDTAHLHNPNWAAGVSSIDGHHGYNGAGGHSGADGADINQAGMTASYFPSGVGGSGGRYGRPVLERHITMYQISPYQHVSGAMVAGEDLSSVIEISEHDPDVDPIPLGTGLAESQTLYSVWTTKRAQELTPTEVADSGETLNNFHFRMPFESLIEPERHFAAAGEINANFFDPHPSSSVTPYISGGPNKGPVILSRNGRSPRVRMDNMRGSTLYKLAMHNFLAETIDFFVKDDLTGFVSRPEQQFQPFKAGKTYKMRVSLHKNQIVPYSRASAFGPPCVGTTTGSALNPPTFSPFTPAYWNTEDDITNFYQNEDAVTSLTKPSLAYEEITFVPTQSRRYSLKEIFASASVTSVRDIYASSSFDDGYVLNQGYNQYDKMPVSSSVNLFGVARLKAVEYEARTGRPLKVADIDKDFETWTIETKFETPILDFGSVSVTKPSGAPSTFGGAGRLDHDVHHYSRGMWHQYGRFPSGSQGVYLSVQDVKGYGSLADQVGFSAGSRRIGEVQPEKTISEAVVAIPFVTKRGRRRFFRLRRRQIDVALGLRKPRRRSEDAGLSIRAMVEKMQKYIFPPRLDFITNRKVRPFAMYIFEFEQKLEQQDIADIWQNLLPECGTTHDTQTATISHELFEEEFFGNRRSRHGQGIHDRLQWMVFKVKQKAKTNYFAKTSDARDDERYKFEFNIGSQAGTGKESIPSYSYNWPYDYFSLVELVKLDAEIDFEPPKDREPFEPPREPGQFTRIPPKLSIKELAEIAPAPGDTKTQRRKKRKSFLRMTGKGPEID